MSATLSYPLRYSSVILNTPTLFYIDQEGSPIQLGLNNEQVQMIVDDWNTGENLNSEFGEEPGQLKPPRPQ